MDGLKETQNPMIDFYLIGIISSSYGKEQSIHLL